MIAIAHHQLNGSGDTKNVPKNVYHFKEMSVVLVIGLYSPAISCLTAWDMLEKKSKFDFFVQKVDTKDR